MATFDSKAHWEHVYRTKRSDEVSWYRADPATSLALIQRLAPERSARVIDVGGGTSLLVDALLGVGYSDVAVLDVSGTALKAVRGRLPQGVGSRVTWIEADVLTATLPPHAIDVWHDRAVFHFLTDAADRKAYVSQIETSLRSGGHVILATFAEDGPRACSGLPVERYSAAELHAVLGSRFQIVETVREQHVTPSGRRQSFQYCVCRFVSVQAATRGSARVTQRIV